MGLREASTILGKGVGNDCLLCHAGSIAGQSIIGLGNSQLNNLPAVARRSGIGNVVAGGIQRILERHQARHAGR
jgi:hypothetical protein